MSSKDDWEQNKREYTDMPEGHSESVCACVLYLAHVNAENYLILQSASERQRGSCTTRGNLTRSRFEEYSSARLGAPCFDLIILWDGLHSGRTESCTRSSLSGVQLALELRPKQKKAEIVLLFEIVDTVCFQWWVLVNVQRSIVRTGYRKVCSVCEVKVALFSWLNPESVCCFCCGKNRCW